MGVVKHPLFISAECTSPLWRERERESTVQITMDTLLQNNFPANSTIHRFCHFRPPKKIECSPKFLHKRIFIDIELNRSQGNSWSPIPWFPIPVSDDDQIRNLKSFPDTTPRLSHLLVLVSRNWFYDLFSRCTNWTQLKSHKTLPEVCVGLKT